jgi:methylmalonyl-CoA/ethylmalonyl-CoA epimerase
MRRTAQGFLYSEGISGLLRRSLQDLRASFEGGEMAKRVDHIGILVSNLDEAIRLYEDFFGAEVGKIETLPERGVKAAILSLGQGANLELLEPLPDSNMAKVMERRGEGLHHITFEVDNVDNELSYLSEKGVELIDKKARPGFEGMVAFIHPKSLRGVLVELCQKD